MNHRECRKRSLTDFQSQRPSAPKRRRLDNSNNHSPELDPHESLSSTPAGSSHLFLSANEIGPSGTTEVVSPTVEIQRELEDSHWFDRQLSPASPTIGEPFEVQEERLTTQFLENPGNRDIGLRLMALLQTRLDDDHLIDYWKGMVFRTLQGRSQAPDILSIMLKRKGKLDEALEFWKSFVYRYPNKIKYARHLTDTFMSMGNKDGAREFWRSAIPTRRQALADIARSQLAICELDVDPNICAATFMAIKSFDLCWECAHNIGKAMSQVNRLRPGMRIYELIGFYKIRIMSGFLAGLRKEERNHMVEIVQAMPRNQFTVDFLRSQDIETELVTENPQEVDAIRQFAAALERNGEIDAAIELCKPFRDWRVAEQLARLMKSKGDHLAEIDYWSSFEGRLPLTAVESVTSAILSEKGHDAVVEFCHKEISKQQFSNPTYAICSSVNKTLKVEGGWDSPLRVWERLYTSYPEFQQFAAPFLVEALLECNDTANAIELYNSFQEEWLTDDKSAKLVAMIAERLTRDGSINATITFLRSRFLRWPSEYIWALIRQIEQVFQDKSLGQEALPFWTDAYLNVTYSISLHGRIICPLTNSFGKDYDELTEFWKRRFLDEVIQRSASHFQVLEGAIRAKKDLDFEITFWKTLAESHPTNYRPIKALSAALRRASFQVATKYYQSILVETPHMYNHVARDLNWVFKKNGDLNAEIEFWKTVLWENVNLLDMQVASKLMCLFKRRGDVDQAIKFWTDLTQRVELSPSQRDRVRRKLSEATKWKKEVDLAMNFRGVSAGG